MHWIKTTAGHSGLSEERARDLFSWYGAWARPIAAYISHGEDSEIISLADYSTREIEYIVHNEKVVHLDDFLMRRSMLAKHGENTLPVLDEVSIITGKSLSWTGEQLVEEVSPVRRILKEGLDTEL